MSVINKLKTRTANYAYIGLLLLTVSLLLGVIFADFNYKANFVFAAAVIPLLWFVALRDREAWSGVYGETVLFVICQITVVTMSIAIIISLFSNNAAASLLMKAVPVITYISSTLYFISSRDSDKYYQRYLMIASAIALGFCAITLVWEFSGPTWLMNYPAGHRFPYSYSIWESLPFREHGYLIFDSRWKPIESGSAYHGYSHLYTFFYYIPVKLINMVFDIPYSYAIRISPYYTASIIAIIFPLCISMFLLKKDKPISLLDYLFLNVASFSFLLIPDLWTGYLVYDADNGFPLLSILYILLVSVLFGNHQYSLKQIIVFCMLFVLFLPTGGTLFALPLLVLAISCKAKNYNLFWAGLTLFFGGIIHYFAKKVYTSILGLSISGSGLWYRSGLDGDSTYFTNALTAILTPCCQADLRPYSFVFPALILGVVAIGITLFNKTDEYTKSKISRTTFLLIAAGLFSAIFFPQSVSIHPYLYDITTTLLIVSSLIFSLAIILANEKDKSLVSWMP